MISLIKKSMLVCVLMLFIQHAYAKPTGHAVGIHGMVLFSMDGQLFASHMPLHHSMHAHQVILQVALPHTAQQQVQSLLSSSSMVSLRPEVFDLHMLMTGQLNVFKADVVEGHFERGGQTSLSGLDISVQRVVLNQPLTENENGRFSFIAVTPKSGFLVHQIGKLSSFDQIIAVTTRQDLHLQDLESGTTKPLTVHNSQEVFEQAGLKWQRQLYLELQDFSQPQ